MRTEIGSDDGDMFVLGGFIDQERTASVERLPRDREAGWESSNSMPEPR